MTKVVIRPSKQRHELIFLLVSIVSIISIATLLISLKRVVKPTVKLKNYQISAFDSLSNTDQSIFSDLFTSAVDIELKHNNGSETWPQVSYMENNYISPFAKDALWESRGRITWKNLILDKDNVHRVLYMGKSNDNSVAASFLLYIKHYHSAGGTYYNEAGKVRPYSIWYKKEGFTLPVTISEGTLISDGWKEVVAYSGSNQRKDLGR